ncbi:MAG: hypothetical protein JWP58_683 [Hymenobacter sp.]|nr:hypothetical protein [Hymenobacter sp.]
MPHFFPSTLSRPAGFLAALGLLATPGAAQGQAPASFGAATTYSAGSSTSPIGIAVGDVNGDGLADLVTANSGTNSVSVLAGQAGGGFAPAISYATGNGGTPLSVAVADVNGDGRLDILAGNSNNSTVSVLLQQAAGGFAPVAVYSTGSGTRPAAVVVADVNGDGRPDIVTANYASSNVSILPGQAGGTFAPASAYDAGTNSQPNGLAVADVNGDGRPDIVTANYASSTAGVLLAQASGGFAAPLTYSTGAGSQPAGIAVTDVNGDGRPDLVTANLASNTVGVLLGQSAGGFAPVVLYNSGLSTNPQAVAVADVNGDRRPDIIIVSYYRLVGVLLGQAGGGFPAIVTFFTGTNNTPRALAAADVNGDGRPDIITANQGSDTAGVLLNTGTFTTLAATPGAPAADVTLFPNPARGSFAVQLPAAWGAASVRAELLNALGQVAATRTTQTTAGAPLIMETAGLSAGIYTLRLHAGGHALTKRVVVE